MSEWSGWVAELERIDFELQQESEWELLEPWLQRRAEWLARLETLDAAKLEPSEQVRLAQAMQRGQELLEHWGRKRERIRTEAGNLHASRMMMQALQPSARGAHFSFDS